jgi:hypothetical protein
MASTVFSWTAVTSETDTTRARMCVSHIKQVAGKISVSDLPQLVKDNATRMAAAAEGSTFCLTVDQVR